MSDHSHHHHAHSHHHHHPDQGHPPAAVRASILRLSALQRLGFAAALIALVWAAVFWGDAVKPMTEQLRFRNLTLGYDRHPAVHHLDGAVRQGSLTAVVGPNGAGKSTLFKGVVGVIKPLAGRIEHHGVRPEDIAYLPQTAEIDRTFPINVYDMVAMGLWRRKGLFGGVAARDRDIVEGAIAAVGLTGFEPRPIGTLSGGQMQRMLFARLLLQDARVIVLDEPFNAIDAKTSADLLALVRRWHSEQRTVLAALHDLDLVKANFPEALLLAREPVAWGATADVLTADNMQKARRMCEAFDEQAEACVAEAV